VCSEFFGQLLLVGADVVARQVGATARATQPWPDQRSDSQTLLKRGTATVEAILKRYNSYNVTHSTYKALAEVGKAEKSIFLCDYLPFRETQYEVHEELNVVENGNATNDFICYCRQGELATNSREQQEIVTLSLQLLQNCLMLINTILVERTIEREGLWERLSAEDLRILTPLFHGHINPYGQFALDLDPSVIPRGCLTVWQTALRANGHEAHLSSPMRQFYCVLSQRPSP
jgi:hypothetical protein